MSRRIRFRKAAWSRIVAASLVLGMAAPGAPFAQERSGSGESVSYETETQSVLSAITESEALPETETESEIHREEQITISSAEDLEDLAKRCVVDRNSKDLEAVLTEDISLTGKSFLPIPYFAGIFDGQGHTIRGAAILTDSSNQGMFRYVGKGAVIRNLNVEGRFEPGKEAQSIGGIAGVNAGTILNCSFRGSVRALEDGGGIAGINEADGLISGCTFEGKVAAQHRAGGIAGQNSGSILACTNQGEINDVYIETDAETKSLLTADLKNLYSFDVSSVSQEDFVDIMDIGGIAGYSEGMISECRNAGTVGYAHIGYNVGGIAGRSLGYTANCTNEGEVYGRKDIGGILGQLEPESIWEYSRSQAQELKSQLNQLNALFDQLAQDVADSTGTIRDDIAAASGYAGSTISSLQGITDEIGGDIAKTSSSLSEAVAQLQNAVDEEDVQALRTALAQLAQTVAATDVFGKPVNVTVTGNSQSDLSTLLDAREADWWQKLDTYLNSRESRSGQQIVPSVQPQPDAGSTSAEEPALIDTGASDTGASDTGTPDAGTSDAGMSDMDYTGQDAYDPGLFGEDLYESPVPDAEPAPSEDAVYDWPAEEDTVIPDENLADVIAQDADMTGAEDAIIEDGDGQTVLDFNADMDRNVTVGGNDLVDKSRESSLQVDVDGNLPDTTQLRSLLQTVLTDFAMLLDPVSLSNAMEILKSLQVTPPDTGAFYGNFQNLAASVVPIADDAGTLTAKAAADVDAITDQLDQILDNFFDLAGNVSLEERYVEADVSEQDPYQSDSSAVESCRNEGAVNADTNAGGIAGCIGFENKLDAEGVLDVSQYLLKDARYTIFAAVRACYNSGPVTAKKETAGGAAGSMEFGIVTDSVNTGAVCVQEGDYCGGISGLSKGTISSCCAGSLLTGNAYTGGIAGRGMTIRDCISYSYIDGGTKYQGAIAGCADGTVSGCRYVDYGVGGIDNVGYAGLAEPMPYGQEQTAKPQSTGNTCTVTFVVEEEEYQQVRVPFGGSIGTLPEVPNRGDDYWVWDDFDQEHIFSDQTVTGSYHRAATTLASGGDVPQYLVEGVFYEGQELTVSDYEMEESPVSTESFAELIEKDVKEETEKEEIAGKISRARQDLKRIIKDRLTGPLLDAKTLSVNGYDQDLKVRVRASGGGRLFTASGDEALTQTDYTTDGSYIVFPLKNGGSFAYYETIRQNKDMRGRAVLICAIAAAALLILVFLLRRRRKKKQAKKQTEKKQEKKTQGEKRG